MKMNTDLAIAVGMLGFSCMMASIGAGLALRFIKDLTARNDATIAVVCAAVAGLNLGAIVTCTIWAAMVAAP